jgi:hypothetical protein
MARTATRPPDDPRMWRRLLARAHPDSGGDGELFIWTGAVREVVCGGELGTGIPRREHRDRPPADERRDTERVPFDPFADFASLTDRALSMANAVAEPYGYLLRQVADCRPAHEGVLYDQQRRGATYKQLAAIAHRVGMTKAERVQWYDVCRSIPLSQRHAGHILGNLKRRAA